MRFFKWSMSEKLYLVEKGIAAVLINEVTRITLSFARRALSELKSDCYRKSGPSH